MNGVNIKNLKLSTSAINMDNQRKKIEKNNKLKNDKKTFDINSYYLNHYINNKDNKKLSSSIKINNDKIKIIYFEENLKQNSNNNIKKLRFNYHHIEKDLNLKNGRNLNISLYEEIKTKWKNSSFHTFSKTVSRNSSISSGNSGFNVNKTNYSTLLHSKTTILK